MGSFLYQYVDADVYMPYHPYQPQILYLGRHNYLEDLGLPSKPEDHQSMHIFALVSDIYGNIVVGNLSYSIGNQKPLTEKMILWSGTPTNGTWWGKIPIQTADMPSTVRYSVFFKDDHSYNVTKFGPYSSLSNEENIAAREGQGFNATDRYILIEGQQDRTVPAQTRGVKMYAEVTFNALVSVPPNDFKIRPILYI
jgi:hypothetical protein